MTAGLLALNAGQSSVKAALFAVVGGRVARTASATIADLGTMSPSFTCDRPPSWGPDPTLALSHDTAARVMLDWAIAAAPGMVIRAVGHRITHGGLEFGGPVLATPATVAVAARYTPLVPLHQPHNLELVEAVEGVRTDLPQVLCFDTAFHRTMPGVARWFALPRELIDEGVVRYGFHGLSYESIVAALPAIAGGRLPARLVVAHLGAGASLCAIREGRSVACTLGMTGMDGLPMGTRVGAIDPGALLYLLEQKGMDAGALAELLWRRSGLLGLSGGISARMQDLLASPDPRAREAVEFFVYRVVREVGSMAAALGGLDALVFTGGCGERSAVIRSQVGRGLRWLGMRLDDFANAAGGPRITTAESDVAGWVVPSDEEGTIARHVLATCPGAFDPPRAPARRGPAASAAAPAWADGVPGGPPIARNVP